MYKSCKLLAFLLVCAALDAKPSYSQQLSSEQLKEVTPTILQLCLHPDRKGDYLSVKGRTGANVIFKIVGIEAEGEITHQKWNGISIALDKYGDSPRQCAVEILKLLAPDEPNKQSREDEIQEGKALIAALDGSDIAFEKLLRQIENVNARDAGGQRALPEAAYRTDQKKLRLLLSAGADPNLTDESIDELPINRVITQYNNAWSFREKTRIKANTSSREFCTRWEVEKIQMLEALLARGAKISGSEFRGRWTPLMSHASADHCPMLELGRLLIRSGASVNAVDSGTYSNTTALMLAVEHGFPETVLQLLKAGADPDVRGQFGRTALIDLAEDPYVVDDGAGQSFKSSTRSDCWNTDNGNTLKFKYLLRYKANATLRDEDGKTAEDYLRTHLRGGCKTASCNGTGRNGWGRCYERMLGYLTQRIPLTN